MPPNITALCTWGPDSGIPASAPLIMRTDSVGVLKHGVALGIETFREFRRRLHWPDDKPDKVICHQVGSTHQRTILESIGIDERKDFSTYRYLGNIGTGLFAHHRRHCPRAAIPESGRSRRVSG